MNDLTFARKNLTKGFGALLALLVVGGCHKAPQENPLLEPPVVQVSDVKQGDVPIVREWIGSLDGSNNAELRAKVSGYILKQNYKDGSLVKQGDLLFEIDPRPFQAALAEAQASLAQAKAEQVKAQLNADKYVKAYQTNAVSEQDRDNAVQQNEAAKAKVVACEASVEQAQLNLDYTKVTAPLGGIISIATRNIGDLVGPSDSQPLATLSTVDPIRVYFQISEQVYLKAAERFSGKEVGGGKKLPVQLVLANGSLYPLPGEIVAVDRDVQGSTGTIRIAALFPNPNNVLRPGGFARVRVVVAVDRDAMLVPQQAVNELQGSYQLAVVGADDKVSIRVVTTGPQFGQDWVIKEGVKPGERVVVEGLQKVSQGKLVVPKPYVSDNQAPAAPEKTKE